MSLRIEWVEWLASGRRMRGYAARPARARTPLPAVIVIQEIWGVDDHIRDVTERIAKAGYLAVAPDLYAVDGKRPDPFQEERIEEAKAFFDTLPPGSWGDPAAREEALNRLDEPSRSRIAETLQALFGALARDTEKHVDTLKGLTAFLGDFEPCRGRPVASVGFCMGGALSALLACREPKLAGAVMFYGRLPGEEEVQNLQCPLLGFFAEEDPAITGGVPAFGDLMRRQGKQWESHVYKGAKHAFFNDTRSVYDVEASADAWVRTLGFFHKVLRRGEG
ncbi:MAG: dienelactone hydrolase family protein [Alicyclobacillaceae bacterium]|nr:dienelactone hydrolase family protein [Alicyclobacillaceae bacterium]